jgi:hypothetical protein
VTDRPLLYDRDDTAVRHVLDCVREFVDARLGGDSTKVGVGIMPFEQAVNWRRVKGELRPRAPLGYYFREDIRLRSHMLDRIDRFVSGDFSSGVPFVDALEREGIAGAVFGLRVAVHERVHASAASAHGHFPGAFSGRPVLEGITQLYTDRLIPELLTALGWIARDRRVTTAGQSPVYPAETAVMSTIIDWVGHRSGVAPDRLLLESARRSTAPGEAALHLMRYVDPTIPPPEPNGPRVSLYGCPYLVEWDEALYDLPMPERGADGQHIRPPAEQAADGVRRAERIIEGVEQRLALGAGAWKRPRPAIGRTLG